MQKKIVVRCCMIIAIIGLITLFVIALDGEEYYVVSLCLIGIILLGFLFQLDRRLKMRDVMVIAVLCGVAVVARIAFFMIPQCKPVAALVIIAGCAMGAEAGFATGAITMFISNFYFGQGPYTPFQMLAMGIVGFLAGVLFHREGREHVKSRIVVTIYGVFAVIVLYGGIVDLNTIFIVSRQPTWEIVISTYAVALPMDVIHGITTGVFLMILYGPVLSRLQRVQRKYGI